MDPQEVRVKNPYVSQEDVSLFFMESDKNEDGKVTLDEYLHTQYSNHDVVFWRRDYNRKEKLNE